MAFSEFDFTAAPIPLCLLLLLLLLLLASAAQSAARDVRPSDHGLGYQQQQGTPSADASPPEMMSFFGASAPPPTPSSALPKALNSTETSWMRPSSGSRRRDRVREILLVVSLVCGVTGVALLVGSALFFLFKLRKERRSAPKSTPCPPSLPPPPKPAAADINCQSNRIFRR